MTVHWYLIEGINPQPWTSPEATIIRKGGKQTVQQFKKEQLRTYQAAIEEALAPLTIEMTTEMVGFDVWFWRQIESYRNDNDRLVVKHRADRSNLLKALEDPLQGHLYKNDVQIQGGGAWIVEQERDTEPAILFRLYELPNHRHLKGLAPGHAFRPVMQRAMKDGVAYLATEDE